MNSLQSVLVVPNGAQTTNSIRSYLNSVTDNLLASLPDPGQLSSGARRGIIARYSAVLEGNFIYWMTGAYIAAKTDESREIIMDNLLEEVRDSHPNMLRKFEMAADAMPTEADTLAVYPGLTEVRLFIGRLSAVPIMATMAFFESFIQRFMSYLEELAIRQGSSEVEYTQVHGVCDIAHSEGLFNALEAEMVLAGDSREPSEYLYEGVHLLRDLIKTMFTARASAAAY